MSALIAWVLAAGYLAAALTFARSTLRRWQAIPNSETATASDGVDRAASAAAALLFGALWPITLAFWSLRDWLWKPIDKQAARVDQMRIDRDYWRQQVSEAATEAERDTARRIVETLDDLINRGRS